MNAYPISIKPFGKHALIVEWPDQVEEAILKDILQFNHHLKEHCLEGEHWELIPSYNSLTLVDIAHSMDFEMLKPQLLQWYDQLGKAVLEHRFLWRLPVCYDEEFGIDLAEVSLQLGKSVENIIALHTEQIYTVYGIGFLPGFMYLGGLPKALEIPRKEVPRLKVANGAVGLASRQTGIYPQQSPGGWNIIGNCPVKMFNTEQDPPCFVSMGDKIQFYPISKAEHELFKIENEVGVFKLEKQQIDA